MKLSEQQISELIEQSLPSMTEGLKQDLQNHLLEQIKWSAQDEIGKFVREWIKGNVIPEVEKELIEATDGLIKVGASLANTMVTTLTAELTKELQKRLSESWTRKNILEAMFS